MEFNPTKYRWEMAIKRRHIHLSRVQEQFYTFKRNIGIRPRKFSLSNIYTYKLILKSLVEKSRKSVKINKFFFHYFIIKQIFFSISFAFSFFFDLSIYNLHRSRINSWNLYAVTNFVPHDCLYSPLLYPTVTFCQSILNIGPRFRNEWETFNDL